MNVDMFKVERVLKEQLDQCKVIHLNQLTNSHIQELKVNKDEICSIKRK